MVQPPLLCRRWLPTDALQINRVQAMLEDVLRTWSQEWLARRSLAISTGLASVADLASHDGETAWSVLADTVALFAPMSSRLTLARAMLDAPDGAKPASPEDTRVVDELVRVGLDDLRERLRVFSNGESGRWRELPAGMRPELTGAWQCSTSLGGRSPVLQCAFSNEAVAGTIRNSLPSQPVALTLTPLSEAVGAVEVEVSARVGCARLSVAELADLAAGDVVLLDQGLTRPAILAVDARVKSGFGCLVERREHGFVLKLLQSLEPT